VPLANDMPHGHPHLFFQALWLDKKAAALRRHRPSLEYNEESVVSLCPYISVAR
jgi:hypothetical protein